MDLSRIAEGDDFVKAMNYAMMKQFTALENGGRMAVLMGDINEGIYAHLPRYLKNLSREYKNDRAKLKQDEYKLQAEINGLLQEYQTMNKEQRHDAQDISNPQIIISETFI